MKLLSKKKKLIYIPVVMFVAIGVVILLAWSSSNKVSQKNGFNRKVVMEELKIENVCEKKPDIVSVVGSSSGYIYFKTKDPRKIFRASNDLKESGYVNLDFISTKKIEYSFNPIIDSPFVYILASNIPGVIVGDMNSGKTISTLNFPSTLFTKGIMISPSTFVFRTFNSTKNSLFQTFIKGDPYSGKVINTNDALSGEDDTGIPSDGMLSYDNSTNLISYIQFYNNNIIVMDTNLNIVRSGRTIDTTFHSATEMGSSSKGGVSSYSNSTPKRFVNWVNCTYKGLLFNNSLLNADNENNDKFLANSAIDIYKLNDGSYKGSIYIPQYQGEKMNHFRVSNDLVIATYKSYIVTYKLPAIE
jgi:hypothetical protein